MHENPRDVRVTGGELYLLPIETRTPLKFGPETVTSVTCARVRITVEDRTGRKGSGWGETPLSVQWAWPSTEPYAMRYEAMRDLVARTLRAWTEWQAYGHPLELGHDFVRHELPKIVGGMNVGRSAPIPYLAGLVSASVCDQALHDAYGVCHGTDVYSTYEPPYLNRDLASFLEPEPGSGIDFAGRWPKEYFVEPPNRLPAWHLVGGLDAVTPDELTGKEPSDGYPVVLQDWIETDGLTCLKIKLRGIDAEWDYARIVSVGRVAIEHGVVWLSADFNCTVDDPQYVNAILDRLRDSEPRIYGMLLYVEQPFPYDLEEHRIRAHSVSARKPLFLDESAHDWQHVRLGHSLGWSGVALKTCKTQSGAILSLCWAKAHGMPLMVQDLSNPMLAQIPHVRLAAHAGTIMGVETNSMQFYPEASLPEAKIHPGLYRRRNGHLDLSTLRGPGFGYRADEIPRQLPPAAGFGELL